MKARDEFIPKSKMNVWWTVFLPDKNGALCILQILNGLTIEKVLCWCIVHVWLNVVAYLSMVTILCIFRTRINSTIYKYFYRNEGWQGQLEQRLLTNTGKIWRVRYGYTYLLFSSVYNAPSSFSKSKRSLRCKERGTLQTRRPLLSNVILSVL